MAPVAHQEQLINQLKFIFPEELTHLNARKNTDLKHPTSGAYLELDVWIPQLNIAFEFQDAYHYVPTWYNHISHEVVSKNDNVKRDIVQQKEITFVVVPCWWDGSTESLEATMHFHRPDLVPNYGIPVHMNPPAGFFPALEIPDIGEPMLASFPPEAIL
eukprot:Phypoly_transcript_24980.p1 GENE.Phypoly_transcript_24980~~Phypoly_transcript_24980.p1  ORF type:complete len:172 (+),score=27.54 Phypoly_transcript_24980:42-518(+)